MAKSIVGFLIAGVGLIITLLPLGSLGLGVVIIGCTIVLMPVARKALSREVKLKLMSRNKVDKDE